MSFDTELAEQAAFFSPLSFLKKAGAGLGEQLLRELHAACQRGELERLQSTDGKTLLFFKHLAWDSNYFGIPTYRVDFMASSAPRQQASEALEALLAELQRTLSARSPRYYLFAELPSENTLALQAACSAKWRMVETRLCYYRESMANYEYARRFPVRRAEPQDIPGLREVAIQSRNEFDRFHADTFFSPEVADAFLATFVENSVNGFADITLVPHPDEAPPDAFLTANLLPPQAAFPTTKFGKMVLSAVGEARKGWYVKLISEMSYSFKNEGVDIAFMTTQSTNRAVIRVWEKLGYSYGRASHVFVHVQA